MFVGNLKQWSTEKKRLPYNVQEAIDLALLKAPWHTLEPGRHELGRGHYMNVDVVTTEHCEHRKYEAHCRYTDVQIVLFGSEYIDYLPLESAGEPVEDYIVEKDIAFYLSDAPYTRIDMTEDTYAVFFPEDAHRPLVAKGAVGLVRKIIIKANNEVSN